MSLGAAAERNLRWLLRPVESVLSDQAMTDLHINGPNTACVDRGRGMERIALPFTAAELEDIAINAAALTGQDIAADVPLVSTRFPNGHRVQIARPPATNEGVTAFSIRHPSAHTWTPAQLEQGGVFAAARSPRRHVRHAQLASLHAARQWRPFLELAVHLRLNIVFSGTVGSGKTHNLRAFTHCIPADTRIVTIEDMAELIGLPQWNVLNLFYSKGGQSAANLSAEQLVEASLRMGPDLILNQELRDASALAFVNVLRSGHWGMTTTHADSAADAFARIAGLVKESEAGRHQNEADILATLHRSIDVVAHCVRDGNRRWIEDIHYDPAAKAPTTALAAAE